MNSTATKKKWDLRRGKEDNVLIALCIAAAIWLFSCGAIVFVVSTDASLEATERIGSIALPSMWISAAALSALIFQVMT